MEKKLDRGELHTRKMQEFNAKFSFSGFWLDTEYPKSYNEIEKFLRETLSKVITEVIAKVEQECVEDYHKFVPEIRAEAIKKTIAEIRNRLVAETTIGENTMVVFDDIVKKLRKN